MELEALPQSPGRRSSPSNLSRSISCISLSDNWTPRPASHAFGTFQSRKVKVMHFKGVTKSIQSKTKRAYGWTYVSRKGPSTDEIQRKLEERLADTKLQYVPLNIYQSKHCNSENVNDIDLVNTEIPPTSSNPLISCESERRGSMDNMALFKQGIFRSDLIRGVYPNSSSVDSLIGQTDESPNRTIDAMEMVEISPPSNGLEYQSAIVPNSDVGEEFDINARVHSSAIIGKTEIQTIHEHFDNSHKESKSTLKGDDDLFNRPSPDDKHSNYYFNSSENQKRAISEDIGYTDVPNTTRPVIGSEEGNVVTGDLDSAEYWSNDTDNDDNRSDIFDGMSSKEVSDMLYSHG